MQPHTPTQVITYNQQGALDSGRARGRTQASPCPPSPPPPREGCLLPGLLASFTCQDDTVTLSWFLASLFPSHH